MQCLVIKVDESEFPSQAVTVLVWSSEKHVVLLPWWMILHFLLTNSRPFSSSAAFSWFKWEEYLLELIVFLIDRICQKLIGFLRRSLYPSNPTIYTTSPSLDAARPLAWLVVVHFTCPMISSVPHYCTLSTVHHPSQLVFKKEHFHYI